jgi:hypothetical protein
MRYFRIIIVAVSALVLSGCLRSQQPLNPPTLVTARDTDMAIQLFMQATILLGRYYDFDTLKYEELTDRSVRHGYEVLPFMPPISRRATPRFVRNELPSNKGFGVDLVGDDFRKWANTKGNGGQKMLVTYYISTGWRAAQLVCRNYMIGLEERNAYLEFLQKEFNIGAGLANASLIAAGANVTLRAIGIATQLVGNETIDAYQAYRFLDIDRDAARTLVESAQNLIADKYLDAVSKMGDVQSGRYFFPADPGFSEAVQAVSLIEYQCTRSGIRGLISKAGVAAAGKKGAVMGFDIATGQIEFKEPAAKK